MGSVQDIKSAFLELSLLEREKLINELRENLHTPPARDVENYTPTERQKELGVTTEMVAKHPILKFAGMWSEEEADRIAAAIKEADWIDEDDESYFG